MRRLLHDDEFIHQITEQASTRALGWILEQHCELHWAADNLYVYFHGNHRMAHELLHEDDTLRTLQDIVRNIKGRTVAVHIIDGRAPAQPLPVQDAHDTDLREAQERIEQYAQLRPTLQELADHYTTMESISREEVLARQKLGLVRATLARFRLQLKELSASAATLAESLNDEEGGDLNEDRQDLDR
jgi:hypothetical protein